MKNKLLDRVQNCLIIHAEITEILWNDSLSKIFTINEDTRYPGKQAQHDKNDDVDDDMINIEWESMLKIALSIGKYFFLYEWFGTEMTIRRCRFQKSFEDTIANSTSFIFFLQIWRLSMQMIKSISI